MIEVVPPDRHQRRAGALEQMFELRYRVFHERLGWTPARVDRQERDEFDELGATYFLAWASKDVLVGAWRILPTTGPYMLRDVFPELLEGRPAPAHPRIWECSRFAVDKGPSSWIDGRMVREMTFRLMEALAEFCLVRDIGSVITVYDRRVGRLLEFMNCKPQWTSRALSIGGVSTQAGLFSISTAHLSTVRDAVGLAPEILPSHAAITARSWAPREPRPMAASAMGMSLDA